MALPSFLNPRNPLPWIVGVAGGGILLIGVSTYNAMLGPSATFLDDYTVLAESQSLRQQVAASGTVVPIRSVNISPNQAGELKQLLVDQGMRVEQGQRLAVMDNEAIFTQGAQAEARFKQAVANLREAELRAPTAIQQARARVIASQSRLDSARARVPTEIEQANAELQAALERRDRAQARVERYTLPTEQGAISNNAYDDALVALRRAQADVRQAEESLRREAQTARPEIQELEASLAEARAALAQTERSSQAEIASQQAAVEASRAAVEEVRVQFENTLITAPFEGIITQRYATPGAFVTPTTSGSTAASSSATSILALAEGLEVVAKVPEIDIPDLEPGQFVELTADAYPEESFRGRVRLIAPEAIVEQNVTSFEVRILLEPRAIEALLPGMNVDITFLGEQLARTVVVPTVAIVTEDGETGVMVPDANNKPEFRPVVLGSSLEDQTQIISGLEEGERVFIDLPEQYRRRDES